MSRLRAVMVCVGYEDLLAVTLPYNRHHFDEVHIITDSKSFPKIADYLYMDRVEVWTTDLFYADGAAFNKWRALEWGLDQMGRAGWLCLMDADVLWPKEAPLGELTAGFMYGAGRYMAPWPLPVELAHMAAVNNPLVPQERWWSQFLLHRNSTREFPGYTQIFRADDRALGPPPWHEQDWAHAGGADSLFQRKWPEGLKRRFPWRVLHLGEPGKNWFGRATPLADGTILPGSERRLERCAELWRNRRALRAQGATEAQSFSHEKLPSPRQRPSPPPATS